MTRESFRLLYDVNFKWFVVVMSLFIYISLENSFLKYTFLALHLLFLVLFMFSFGKLSKLHDLIEDLPKDKSDFIKERKKITKRKVLNYLNRFPIEHPYTAVSIIGLFTLHLNTDYFHHLSAFLTSLPFFGYIYSNTYVPILLMLFMDFIFDHITIRLFRIFLIIIVILYLPLILSLFLIGLIGPLLRLLISFPLADPVYGYISLANKLKDPVNLISTVSYPIVVLSVFQSHYNDLYKKKKEVL